MRQPESSVRRLAMPIKGLVRRFAFLLLVSGAVGLLILGKTGSPLVERLRITITDASAPVLETLSHPVASATAVVDGVRELFNLHSENARLRADNERLRHWQVVARRLGQENVAFRDLLNLVSEPGTAFITARVIGDSGGAFVRTVLLTAGARDGVRNGQAVVNGDGMVGRVVDTGERSARVLLLTDLNSRVPVVVESTRVSAILAGDNTDRQRLIFLPVDARVSPGERIVTSGHGGMFPPGLPIGVVSAVEEGAALVQPFVGWHALEYVRVLDYSLPGVLPVTRAAGRAEPLR